MNCKLAAGLLCSALAFAASPPLAVSSYSESNFPLTADPKSPQWKPAPNVFADHDSHGKPVPGHHTEIRSRWTNDNLYVLFVCPYEDLYLKPNPTASAETNKLWNWDVAEIFIGADFQNIQRYKEFEISPQGEWVDLDIDRKQPLPEGGWLWNSGFRSKSRIDRNAKIWYGEMQIPWTSISPTPPKAGQEFRVNFYRMQGPPQDRKKITWQPTNSDSFHVPEAFGVLKLEAERKR
jgi:hypothetical protein